MGKYNLDVVTNVSIRLRIRGFQRLKTFVATVCGLFIAISPVLMPGIAHAGSTEFATTTTSSHPTSTTLGPDGNVWFTESVASGKIARVTPAGVMTEFSTGSTATPKYITTGPDGNLWFTMSDNTIGKMTTSGGTTFYTVPYASGAHADGKIIVGPDGNLWFGDGYSIGTITTSGTVTQYPVYYNVTSITTGPDGNIWFVTSGQYTGYMTTSGAITAGNITNFQSNDITTGPDGNLWITNIYNNSISRLTTARVATNYSIPTASSTPLNITTGPDGALWFTEQSASQVGRITTSGTITEYATPTASSNPSGITSGSDGNIWYAETLASKVVRLSF